MLTHDLVFVGVCPMVVAVGWRGQSAHAYLGIDQEVGWSLMESIIRRSVRKGQGCMMDDAPPP